MDLSKAFDTIDHDILVHKLHSYGIKGRSLIFFKDYLTERKFIVKYSNNFSESRQLRMGVPQGSILGPFLFFIC